MFERFTESARQVMRRAKGEAISLDSATIGTEHLLLALLADETGAPAVVLRAAGLDHGRVRELIARRTGRLFDDADADALRSIGVDLDAVLDRLTESFGPDAVRGSRRRRGAPRLDDAAKLTLGRSVRQAVELGDSTIAPQHVLLGILVAESGATRVLADAGVDSEQVRASLLSELGKAA